MPGSPEPCLSGNLTLRIPSVPFPLALNQTLPANRRTASFTVVEVMMATLILMVGFIGLIEAVALTTNAMDHARRQSLAAQILAHHVEEYYLANWATISGLSTTSAAVAIDSQFDAARQALGDDLLATTFATSTASVRFSLARVANADPVTNIREIKFTVSWVVKTSRRDAAGNRLTFTHTRSTAAWYGKNGLHLSYNQS